MCERERRGEGEGGQWTSKYCTTQISLTGDRVLNFHLTFMKFVCVCVFLRACVCPCGCLHAHVYVCVCVYESIVCVCVLV